MQHVTHFRDQMAIDHRQAQAESIFEGQRKGLKGFLGPEMESILSSCWRYGVQHGLIFILAIDLCRCLCGLHQAEEGRL